MYSWWLLIVKHVLGSCACVSSDVPRLKITYLTCGWVDT